MLLKNTQEKFIKVFSTAFHFFYARPRLLHFGAYIALIALLNLGLQLFPDLYFGVYLTAIIYIAAIGSILLIWPRLSTLFIGAASVFAITLLLGEVNRQKAAVTAFPITTTDLEMFAANPSGLLMAIGAPHWSFSAIYLFPVGLLAYLTWSTRRRLMDFGLLGFMGRTLSLSFSVLTVCCSLLFLNTSVVGAVSAYVNSHILELEIWEPEGMVDFPEKVGILGFLSYSQYIESGDRNHFLTYSPTVAPPSLAEVEASVRKYTKPEQMQLGLLPNIVVVHAESTFDPNDVLNLVSPTTNTLFYTHPGTRDDPAVHFHGPALANTIGGGSWISEFEAILGIDSRLFGVAGRFTHASVSQFARRTFPRYLHERGYDVSAFLTTDGSFYNSERAYENYGFDHFFDADYLESTSDDLVIMKSALQREVGSPGAPFMKFVLLAENHSPHWCDPLASSQYEKVELVGDPTEEHTCAIKEYVRRARSTEGAVAFARSYLEAEKIRTGREYVIAIYGDHQPYSFTGGGAVEHNMGLDFDSFRLDHSKRKVILQIISSKPNPLICCGGEAVPLTLLPTLVSSYVADSISDLYLPESLYQLDHCGGDWIGHLVGTTFYGRSGEVNNESCDRYEELIAAYKKSDVIGSLDVSLFEVADNERALPTSTQAKISGACLDRSGNLPIEVVASGTRFGDAPKFQVLLDGKVVGEAAVTQALDNSERPVENEDIPYAFELFEFEASNAGQPKTLSVQFVNDRWAGTGFSGDTDLWIQSVKVGNSLFSSGEFQFLAAKEMRGEWVEDWFRFATNGVLTVGLPGNLCD